MTTELTQFIFGSVLLGCNLFCLNVSHKKECVFPEYGQRVHAETIEYASCGVHMFAKDGRTRGTEKDFEDCEVKIGTRWLFDRLGFTR